MMNVTHQSLGQPCPISSNEREKGHPCFGQRSADENPKDCWVNRERVSLLGYVLLSHPLIMVTFNEFTYRRSFWFYLAFATFILGLLAIIWVYHTVQSVSTKNTAKDAGTTPDHYSVSIEQEGGGDSEYHTITVDGIAEEDTREADEFVSVDFGWPEEYVDANPQNNVMWAQCLQGYGISNCKSLTSMQTPMSKNTCGMVIEDQPKNVISFECTKR